MVKKDNKLKQKKRDENVIIINPEPLIRLEEGLQNIVKEFKKLNKVHETFMDEVTSRRNNDKESSN
jgi:hypothetical protein